MHFEKHLCFTTVDCSNTSILKLSFSPREALALFERRKQNLYIQFIFTKHIQCGESLEHGGQVKEAMVSHPWRENGDLLDILRHTGVEQTPISLLDSL